MTYIIEILMDDGQKGRLRIRRDSVLLASRKAQDFAGKLASPGTVYLFTQDGTCIEHYRHD
ncbi:MAG: hypothetical protein PHQ12_01135 [Chthoniobacteraceae bacterium]|nr:hypothetical protein [Chthoniobacteraceae bacterium]